MEGNGTATAIAEPVNRIAPLATRKIAIIGKAPSSVALAPYDNPDWEIWVLNTLGVNHEVPRWDRQYELHDLELTKAKEYGNYYPWLMEQSRGDRRIILRDTPPADFGHAAQKYPLDELRAVFAFLPRIYLTNTVSLMIAHALYEHVRGDAHIGEIGLWGVDMAQHGLKMGHSSWFTSEYAKQRPSCEYWIGIACGMGIKVIIPQQSDICRSPCIYGYHHTEAFKKMEARRKELQQRIAHAQQIEQQKHDEAVYLSGALESTNYELQSEVYPVE